MRILIISFAVLGLMAGVAYADSTSKPNLIFTPSSCMLRITPQDGVLLEGWSICVSDRASIGVHHESENIECDQMVAIPPHFSIDMSLYLDDCETAVPNDKIVFEILKSYYK